MANINPSKPNQGNILKKSPILAGTDRLAREKKVNADLLKKDVMQPALGGNLKDIKRSITPTVRSKPNSEY